MPTAGDRSSAHLDKRAGTLERGLAILDLLGAAGDPRR
jgi:hypothetical protein